MKIGNLNNPLKNVEESILTEKELRSIARANVSLSKELDARRMTFQYRLVLSMMGCVFVLIMTPLILSNLGRRTLDDTIVNTTNQSTLLLIGGLTSAISFLVGSNRKVESEQTEEKNRQLADIIRDLKSHGLDVTVKNQITDDKRDDQDQLRATDIPIEETIEEPAKEPKEEINL